MARLLDNRKSRFLYEALSKAIRDDYDKVHRFTVLPSERDLCGIYNVSRTTVRKAIAELEREGIVSTIQGKGTFFTGRNAIMENSPAVSERNISFYDQVADQGSIPYSKVLRHDIQPADEEIAEKLNISPGDVVMCLERVRYIDDDIYQTNRSYVAYNTCPELMKLDFSGAVSHHQALREHGIVIYSAEKVILFEPAEEFDALHLEISKGDPLTVTYTTCYDDLDRTVEYTITKSLAYKTSFKMTMFNERYYGSVWQTGN